MIAGEGRMTSAGQNTELLWPQNEPDFGRLRGVLLRESVPDRVPFIELFADTEIIATVLHEEPIYAGTRQERNAALDQRIRFCHGLGYDYVNAGPGLNLGINFLSGIGTLLADDTAALTRPQRGWMNEAEGVISSMEDFEKYPWPGAEAVDYYDVEYVAKRLPDGMRIIGATSGILEWVMWLMGAAPFSMALYDQPDLIQAMFTKIGDFFAHVHTTLASTPEVGAIFLGDDMGFKTGTFIKPEHMRQYVFPHQKRLVDIAHSYGKPFLLHACGNLGAVMDDLINDVGIDGKHSYEDAILPVSEAKQIYGDRISILGGIDVDFLCRASDDQVRSYTRRVLESCMPGGGYALGTGNSVANYIPVANYLAMLDEGMKVGRYL
jgi:uroporphyrinogen decarboxylase